MKQVAFAAALATALALPAVGHAQVSGNPVTVQVTAAVNNYFAATVKNPLVMGAANPGTGLSVNSGSTTTAGALAAGTAPEVVGVGVVEINHNTPSLTATVSTLPLTHSSGATIAVVYDCFFGSSISSTGTAGACNQNVPYSAASSATTVLKVGGSIAAAATSNKPAGRYNGSITFTYTFPTY